MKRVSRALYKTAFAATALLLAAGFIAAGIFLLWASTLNMPSLASVEERKVEQSTKIYDRTGEILLYDLHEDVKRTIVPLGEVSQYMQHATVAIEDDNFYHHLGIEPLAIVRAVLTNLKNGDLLGGQGGSTITQQVVKNSLLVREKTISRKFKEWVLAVKLERQLTKDQILELYLNESPYGGNKYGVEEAAQGFFGKPASELTIAESAYLAALPQAPTYYSPYGNNREELEERKNKVLREMYADEYITEEEYEQARIAQVDFRPQQTSGIKAPHFVFYVIEKLEEELGKREIEEGGYRIITSLDWELQREAERIVNTYALENAEKYNAENAALVATDPQTGEILVMVGSRDYFDEDIEGNFNIALANRQPGSAFKPFAYAKAIEKGYTTETIVFDLRTQFSTACEVSNLTSEEGCYSPGNYDDTFRGPMTFRDALAQSVNVPAVKVLYLAGLPDTLQLAKRLGISTLGDISRYGLTLVLGGGEVQLLEMTHAYGVFANEGINVSEQPILRIEDKEGEVVRSYEPTEREVLSRDVAIAVTDMLADNTARTPAFGANSFLHFPGYDVAVKTGTTNDYRDAWIIGYTPTLSVGAWAGNNDNTSMEKRVAGFIIAPLWNEFMQFALERNGAVERFSRPSRTVDMDLKPVLRGRYEGNDSVFIDTTTGREPGSNTLPQHIQEVFKPNIHSILHWVNRDDPRGPVPTNPGADGQYAYWEYPVRAWANTQSFEETDTSVTDGDTDTEGPQIRIRRPRDGREYEAGSELTAWASIESEERITRVDFFVNETYLGSVEEEPFEIVFTPRDVAGIETENTFSVVAYDRRGNRGTEHVQFTLSE